MGYIGNQTSNAFTSITKQDLTGVTGSPAKRGFTLDYAVANANEIEVFVNNVRQEPAVAYTVSGTGLTMTGDVETTDDFYVVFQGKAIQTTVPPDDSVTTARINDGAVTTAKIADDAVTSAKLASGVAQEPLGVAFLAEEQTANTSGGTATSGAWRHRSLNTEVYDHNNIVTLSGHQFTLGAGTYIIEWSCPAYLVGRHQARLYDVTGSAVERAGTSAYTNNAEPSVTNSTGSAKVTLTANNTYKIEHRVAATVATKGFGVEANLGEKETYTTVKITKLA